MSVLPHPLPTYPRESSAEAEGREIVCHCLRVTRDEIEVSIRHARAETIKCVMRQTGAGSGCTACHCTIRTMLEAAGKAVPSRTGFRIQQAGIQQAGIEQAG